MTIPRQVVLETDRAWPDDTIERRILEAHDIQLVGIPTASPSAEEVASAVAEYQPVGILTCWAPVNADAIAASRGLKVVSRLGVGLDNIDLAAAWSRAITVTNVPDYCMEEVSDHAVALVLAWARGLVVANGDVSAGNWNPSVVVPRRVSSLRCGILGYGRIGRLTAAKLSSLGCQVIACDTRPSLDIEMVSQDELFARSDVVVIHTPLVPETVHLVSTGLLDLMPHGSLLVNVSRGGVVDTTAVVSALNSGRLSCAALDVLESEPDVPQALRETRKAILTPHIAFSSDEAIVELRTKAARDVVAVLSGGSAKYPCLPR